MKKKKLEEGESQNSCGELAYLRKPAEEEQFKNASAAGPRNFYAPIAWIFPSFLEKEKKENQTVPKIEWSE